MPVSANPLQVPERRIFKPAQLNALARDLLESQFSQIWLEGEVSNLSRPASGHLYFVLKDASAQIRCTMFRNRALYLANPLKDGQQILVRARLTLYEARGDYQLNIESAEPAGQGALQLAYEQLKTRLAAEGLFDSGRKRKLPAMVKRLALITSPRGAAIHDVLTVLARRFPLLPVELWPVPVQGADAAAQITAALQAAIDSGRYDAILLTRGGGSLEDLMPFNDEGLVRLAADCPIPLVSAVGHEVDYSLLDFAADLRAATPSAAAELLSPSADEVRNRLAQLQRRAAEALRARLQRNAQRSDMAHLRLQVLNPAQRLQSGRQALQSLAVRLHHGMQEALGDKIQALRGNAHRLERAAPQAAIRLHRSVVLALHQRLQRSLQNGLHTRLQRLKSAGGHLNAVSPLATLGRGYSILRDDQQRIIHSVQQVSQGQTLHATLSDGELLLGVKSDG